MPPLPWLSSFRELLKTNFGASDAKKPALVHYKGKVR